MNAPWLAQDPCAKVWDVVIIGTGMGGSTAGYELSRLGFSVLFVEKGPLLHAGYANPDTSSAAPGAQPAAAGGDGRSTDQVVAFTNLGKFEFTLPIGSVSGGSSAFYGAALERLSPDDFAPRANFRYIGDSTLPERWPIGYGELEPYYEAAERLYRVRGTQDPLLKSRPAPLLEPPETNARDKHLLESFSALGLHPYRLHVGYEFVPGCDGCPSGPCPRDCKRDAAWTCLMPALARHDAKILPSTEVLRLEAGADRVEQAVCRREGAELRIRGRVFVLAAGAFMTPALLLKSASSHWPDGLANRSGLVGRNLMFHGGDFFAVSSLAAVDNEGHQKTLALNDFYNAQGEKLGTFQSLGVKLEVGRVMQYMRDTAGSSTAWWRWLFASKPVWWRKVTSPVVRLGALIAFNLMNFKRASVWVSIVEDLPYHQNRVLPDPAQPDRLIVEYQYSSDLDRRVRLFRDKVRAALGKHRLMVLTPTGKIDYPHVCGTCRFGDDQASSVLDASNRAHGVDNLYVVDASFFPSSGGTNPSLTIAANALRVAGILGAKLRSS